jgi:hypothetical protein
VEIVLVKRTKHNFVKRLGAVGAFFIVQQPYFAKNFTCLNQIKGRFLAVGRAFRNFDAPVFQKKTPFPTNLPRSKSRHFSDSGEEHRSGLAEGVHRMEVP